MFTPEPEPTFDPPQPEPTQEQPEPRQEEPAPEPSPDPEPSLAPVEEPPSPLGPSASQEDQLVAVEEGATRAEEKLQIGLSPLAGGVLVEEDNDEAGEQDPAPSTPAPLVSTDPLLPAVRDEATGEVKVALITPRQAAEVFHDPKLGYQGTNLSPLVASPVSEE